MAYGLCAMTGHYMDKYPMLGGEPEDVNAMDGYQGQPRPTRFQNTYSSNWRNNSNKVIALEGNGLVRRCQDEVELSPYEVNYGGLIPEEVFESFHISPFCTICSSQFESQKSIKIKLGIPVRERKTCFDHISSNP
uniref:Uncharacterized protein n=1 Tax=Lactuca sativa TaxID=4236 RepID=A0A9R1VJC2_LACSA|nr:hypothetical protein LSAT_V11C500282780 [Lactuca sativa]